MKSVPRTLFLRETGLISPKDFENYFRYQSLKTIDSKKHANKKFADGMIMEIIPTVNLIFAITSLWKCICIEKASFRLLYELTNPGEKSRTIFYNSYKNEMILVFLQENQGEERLRCRTYNINSLENGKNIGLELFTGEDLRTPGFLEFDDINKLIMTKSAATLEYKFWKLDSYSLSFVITDPLIEEIRLTCDLCLLVNSPLLSSIKCTLCSVENGSILDIYEVSIKPYRLIELLELFGSFLLLKQYGEPLNIVNLLNQRVIQIPGFLSPQNFIFLHEQGLFLALRSCVIEVWNFNGKLIKIYNAPVVSGSSGFIPSRLFISRSQDFLLLSWSERTRSLNRNTLASVQKSVIKAFKLVDGEIIKEIKNEDILENLTTVTYDEHFGIVLSGHADGAITWWNN